MVSGCTEHGSFVHALFTITAQPCFIYAIHKPTNCVCISSSLFSLTHHSATVVMDIIIWELTENCLQWLQQCQFDAQNDESGARLDTSLADFDLWCNSVGANLNTTFESEPTYSIVARKMLTIFHQFLWNYAKLLRDAQGADDALCIVDSSIENLASMKGDETRGMVRKFFATQLGIATDTIWANPLGNLLSALQKARDQALLSSASHNTMNEGTDEETMTRILGNATMVDLEDSRPFIPHEKLLEICNEQAVAKELARVFPENDPNTNERLTRSICHGQIQGPYMTSNSCRKTFSVLVLIEQTRAIELFLHHRFCDDDLPLRNTSDFLVLQSSREGPGSELHIPDAFNQYELINNFIDKQWLVLPPDLTKGKMRNVPFPQAREDTLNDLWNKHPHDIITSTGSTLHRFSWWICLQCYNIIRDLQAIYEHNNIPPANNAGNVSKIHIKIKPDNILHINGGGSSLGSLKVSEKSHELVSSTGQQPQFIDNTYQTYRAPEHDIDEIRSTSVGVDTWAVGCLFAEFLTWAIGGKEAVEMFKLLRVAEDENLGSQWVEDTFFFIEQSDDLTKVPKRKNSVDGVC